MNTNVMPSIVRIEKENLKKLVTQVEETLATDIEMPKQNANQKNFSIVDLWNIRKSMKTAVSLRRH